MDPNLFHLDWDRVFEALTAIVVLSMFVERALIIVFEHRAYEKYLSGKGFKAIIAFVFSFIICRYWEFDAVSIIFFKDQSVLWGYLLTAAVVTGGSKGAIKLFQETFDWKLQSADPKKPKPSPPSTDNAPASS
jgi:hypothetical protein